jgi:DNA modification methylase
MQPAATDHLLPAWQDDVVTVYLGDCLDVLPRLADSSVDAVVTDPPYGLEFMGQGWDAPWKAAGAVIPDPATERGGDNPYSRSRIEYGRGGVASVGFHEWCTLWAPECLRVLKPGAHLLAFGGTRTWHRLTCAIEDAGFEIRDTIAWMYGSGFPKSRDVTDAMERYLQGEQPTAPEARLTRPGLYKVTGYLRDAREKAGWTNRQIDELFGTNGMAGHWTSQASQAACPSVRQWEELKNALGFGDDMDELVEQLAATERPEGWDQGGGDDGRFLDTLHKNGEFAPMGGWGTALKPAFEPIVVGRKPFSVSVSANVLEHGTGAINIDGCRVGADGGCKHSGEDVRPGKSVSTYADGLNGRFSERVEGLGRWPTNVVLDETTAAELDRQSGFSTSRRAELTNAPGRIYGGGNGLPSHTAMYGFDDALDGDTRPAPA